ncbi:glycosyltransferase family 2 protein [Kitasatospora sp. NPDC056138]|uniref:glycosyltransferase family 2 protein n=1 Tax=Kitasatospora sp. NPDC056138 TaxID=3345724 RepID=UPI0035E100DC
MVIAVYNTMPYLTACLDSLVGQSIGHRRMEIVAVDDGSTDGSGAELDRYATRHPGLFKVRHQANSGGPAHPTNRGTAEATGRYVLYLGADDWLGAEALERMVEAADRWESEVLVPKQVGENGRLVPQGIFERTAREVTFTDSALAWALADTKLFRRDLLQRHGLRRLEDLPVHSDQPFTLEALLRAERVSVLADYDYYHLVLRRDRSNVTHRAGPLDRLRGVRAIQEVVERLTGPGPVRDAIRSRHFGWEVPQLLQADFLHLDQALQRQLCAGIAGLLDDFCTPELLTRLPVGDRLRLALARRGELAALRGVIEYELANGTPPPVRRRGREYAGYPLFRSRRPRLPDELFALGGAGPDGGWPAGLRRRVMRSLPPGARKVVRRRLGWLVRRRPPARAGVPAAAVAGAAADAGAAGARVGAPAGARADEG